MDFGKDPDAHKRVYQGFMKFTKYSIIAIVIGLVLLALLTL